MKIVIPSRGRSQTIGQHTLKVFPDATVCVAEVEGETYRAAGIPAEQLLLHPGRPTLNTMGAIRQWILDNVKDEVVVMIDDDLLGVSSLTGWNARKITNRDDIMRILENAAECARGMGTPMFGVIQTSDIRWYQPYAPYTLHQWVGGCIGFIGRSVAYDPKLSRAEDIDISLQVLLQHRVIWMDTRFFFAFNRETMAGGMTLFRSAEGYKEDYAYLKQKWGRWIEIVDDTQSTTRVVLKVKRRQL